MRGFFNQQRKTHEGCLSIQKGEQKEIVRYSSQIGSVKNKDVLTFGVFPIKFHRKLTKI